MKVLVLAALLALVAAPSAHTAAAKESRILYSSDWSGTRHIYAVDPAGRAVPAQLTFGPAPTCRLPGRPCGYASPVPSPDGSRLVFSDECSNALFVARADGRGLRRLSGPAALCHVGVEGRDVAWAPGSDRIAYVDRDGVHVVRADGTGNRRVTPLAPGYASPTWSPDGRWLAFARRRLAHSGDWAIEVVASRGGPPRIVARSISSKPLVAWSPSGRWLAYTSGGLFVVAPGGFGGRRLTERVPSAIAWAPDGRSLAVSHSEEGIRLVDAANGRVRVLTSERVSSGLAWSPDGRSLVYERDGLADVAYYRFDGGDLRIVTRAGATRTVVAAAGRLGGFVGAPAWSPAPRGLRYRAPGERKALATSTTELESPWRIDRLAADGDRLALASCGHVFVWTPSTRAVVQADPYASLAPRCSTPDNYVARDTYSLALAGNRIAWGERSGNMGQRAWLGGAELGPALSHFTLGTSYGAAGGPWSTPHGYAAGEGGLLVFSTWRERSESDPFRIVTEEQTVLRAGPHGCPCLPLASSPGPFVPADVNAERVLVYGDNATLVLDRDGRELVSVPFSPLAGQLAGNDLVLVRQGELRHFDAADGSLLHSWPLADVSTGAQCGGAPRCLRVPRLTLEDTARGLVAYVLDGEIRLLRLSDGADRAVARGTMARFLDGGLAYADGRRLRLVAFAQLPLSGT